MFSDTVRAAASGRWDELLRHIAGLSEAETTPTKQGIPCPHCAGHDRYEFKSVDNGYYLCRGCGAGDGWSLLMKLLRVDFKEALTLVAEYLRITPDSHASIHDTRPPPSRPARPKTNTNTDTNTDTIARKACAIWAGACTADSNHPYLLKKNLPPVGLRQHKECLLAPLYSPEHALVNLQFIRPDGSKTFLKGGRTVGCYGWWGRKSWSVYVCEGVADAISLYLTYHRMAIAAYSASNITAVGQHLRERLPVHRLILVPDNDAPTATRKWRAGMTALYGHKSFDEVMLLPEGKDASDLWMARHGQ